MTKPSTPDPLAQALAIVRAGAERAAVAGRLHPDAEQRLLQSIVDATVRLFDAEAASIALFERDPDRLQFAVAAGPQGQGVIGHSVPPTKGIVGYVYSTGEPMALSDVASDPRFDRDDDAPFWSLVAAVSRLRDLGGRELALVTDILDVVARHRPATRQR